MAIICILLTEALYTLQKQFIINFNLLIMTILLQYNVFYMNLVEPDSSVIWIENNQVYTVDIFYILKLLFKTEELLDKYSTANTIVQDVLYLNMIGTVIHDDDDCNTYCILFYNYTLNFTVLSVAGKKQQNPHADKTNQTTIVTKN